MASHRDYGRHWNCVGHLILREKNGSVFKKHTPKFRNYKNKILSQRRIKKQPPTLKFVHNFAFAYMNYKFSNRNLTMIKKIY